MRISTWLAAALAAGLGLSLRAASAHEAAAVAPDADLLYRRYCARCHGSDFKGSEWRATNADMPDFTSATWHVVRSDARLLVSIRDGRGQGMPPFGQKLSEAQQRSLVARLRRAATPAAPPPAAGPDDFEIRFEELILRMEALKKEFYEADQAGEP
jgi:mono/diheme cytochrome c family protein